MSSINFMQTFTTGAADKAVLYEFTDYAHSANYNIDQQNETRGELFKHSYYKSRQSQPNKYTKFNI